MGMDRTGDTRQYWNPLIETLPREKLVQIELKRFRELLQWAKENSPFYRRKLQGIDPQDIKSLEDLAKVPMTEKDELRAAQEGKDFSIMFRVTFFMKQFGYSGWH
jgi:phenylacetate-CoA ligase